MLFGSFKKCLYPLQKLDSDTERCFAADLVRDAEKWFRPVKGQFLIFYKDGPEQREYRPDYVAEAAETIYMVEKRNPGMKSKILAEAASAGVIY